MRQPNVETGAATGGAMAGGRNIPGHAAQAAAPCFLGGTL